MPVEAYFISFMNEYFLLVIISILPKESQKYSIFHCEQSTFSQFNIFERFFFLSLQIIVFVQNLLLRSEFNTSRWLIWLRQTLGTAFSNQFHTKNHTEKQPSSFWVFCSFLFSVDGCRWSWERKALPLPCHIRQVRQQAGIRLSRWSCYRLHILQRSQSGGSSSRRGYISLNSDLDSNRWVCPSSCVVFERSSLSRFIEVITEGWDARACMSASLSLATSSRRSLSFVLIILRLGTLWIHYNQYAVLFRIDAVQWTEVVESLVKDCLDGLTIEKQSSIKQSMMRYVMSAQQYSKEIQNLVIDPSATVCPSSLREVDA